MYSCLYVYIATPPGGALLPICLYRHPSKRCTLAYMFISPPLQVVYSCLYVYIATPPSGVLLPICFAQINLAALCASVGEQILSPRWVRSWEGEKRAALPCASAAILSKTDAFRCGAARGILHKAQSFHAVHKSAVHIQALARGRAARLALGTIMQATLAKRRVLQTAAGLRVDSGGTEVAASSPGSESPGSPPSLPQLS